MTPDQRKRLLGRLQRRLTLRGLRPNTQETYLRMARQFLEAVDKPPARVTRGDVERYLLGLLDAGRCMRTRNVALASIRFLLHATTARDVTVGIPHGKVEERLVTVLTGPEVERVLAATQSAKYRAIFMLAYGAGLRIGEVCALQVGDIDSQRGLIHVRAGKTGERYVLLGKRVLALLRDYWKAHRPPGPELFPGRGARPTLCRNSVKRVLDKVAREAGIDKRVTPHTFRHTCATHLLDSGVDVRSVQVMLGHHSIKSTARYLHVSQARLAALPSPLDLLGTARGSRL
jgi:site-specific recombinase XerD